MELRSESLNGKNLRKCDATGTLAGLTARMMVSLGLYETRGKGKDKGKGNEGHQKDIEGDIEKKK